MRGTFVIQGGYKIGTRVIISLIICVLIKSFRNFKIEFTGNKQEKKTSATQKAWRSKMKFKMCT